MEKTIVKSDGQKASTAHSPSLSPLPSQPLGLPFFDLPRAVGNQAMGRLFESGLVQAKLRVSQPGDADESEADRVAEQIVSRKSAPALQRKCDCGGSCSKCQEEETVLHRSALAPLRSFPFSIERAEAGGGGAAKVERDPTRHPGAHPQVLVVEDEVPKLEAEQMRKAQFLVLLESTTCATADAVLEAVGHTTKGCPYIKKWLRHFREKSAAHLMAAMHKYAPETVKARSAHEAISQINQRVERAALSWAKTGKVSGLPEGMQSEMMGAEAGGGGFLGAVAGFAKSGLGKGLLGFLGGGGNREISFGGKEKEKGTEKGEGGGIQKKSNGAGTAGAAEDAARVKEQLGSGQALDGRVQGRMSSAFGYDFSGVRVHTDSKAGELSSQLQARAFTIGSDVAFAGGEYKPGTLIGDALIAHELAHVVQQGGGQQAGPQTKDAGRSDESGLEQDADRSAVGAVVAAWTGAKKGLAEIGANALPRLKSGLKLQKCSCHKNQVPVKSPTAPPAAQQAVPPPAAPVEPEKSFFFEDPAIQVKDEEGHDIDFSKRASEQGGIASAAQQRRQVVVDKPEEFSRVGDPRKDPVTVVIRFASPASQFPEGKESAKLKSAKQAVIGSLGQLLADLGSFTFADKAEERRILQERARLTEALKGFTKENPLNIYLAEETEEETRSGEFFPTTARVFVNLNDVGNPDKLKTAIRIPLHNILGGPNPAKGSGEDPATTRTDIEKTLLHESIHALLLGRSADSDAQWKRVQGKLSLSGPDKVQQSAKDLVHAYLLAQEELFAYSAVELLFPMKPGDKQEGKPGYEQFMRAADLFFNRHRITLQKEKLKLNVSDKVGGKPVPWEIEYNFPTVMSLAEKDFDVLQLVLRTWPLQTFSRRR